jgi:serine protease Do
VVNGAYDVIVRFSSGEKAQGHILATDTRIDLALIKVNLDHPLPMIHWADSDSLQVGDTVLAIGNPLGIAKRQILPHA